MRGVLKTKIWKMVGLVLGSVLGFVGATVGVLAAMGKFKTPVVYPTVLEFGIKEQMIIEQIPYDPTLDWAQQEATLYSFQLVGSNPGTEHQVNQKSCYLWFDNTESAQLITLCKSNREPLTPDKNNRYRVNCNEQIYYMVNDVDEDEQTDGTVTLYARSTNDTLKKPDSPMVIYIDRVAGNIFVKDMGVANVESLTQTITVGVDIGFDFEYVVGVGANEVDDEESLSLKPIGKESAKNIELYYNVEGMDYGNDYIRVTKEEVDKTNSPLHSILTCNDDGVFTFKSSSSRTHTFYLAVFPTYADKLVYENYIATNSLTNYDKLIKNDEKDPVSMVFTTLQVVVEDIEISDVGFVGSGVVLDLYAQDNNITLNTVSNNPKTYPLGLYMKKESNGTQVDDFTRFDEVNMNGFMGDVWSEEKPLFIASNSDDEWIYQGDLTGMTIESSGISIIDQTIYYTDNTFTTISQTETEFSKDEEWQVINYLYKNGNSAIRYYSSNGVAVVEKTTQEIKLLNSGSYLNFYIQGKDEDGVVQYTRIANFDYEVHASGRGQEKTWNIITKEIPYLDENNNESLCLGILVVNNSGRFVVSNFFDTVPVTLSPIDLSYTVLNEEVDFDITFTNATEEGKGIHYPEISFEELISIGEFSSYNACVLVVEQSKITNCIVDTIPNIKFVVGEGGSAKTYFLVGYFTEDPYGKRTFVNSVRVNNKVANGNDDCEILMLQMKNAYQETAQSIIDSLLAEIKAEEELRGIDDPQNPIVITREITNDKIVQVYNADSITVNAEYILNISSEFIDIQYYDIYELEGEKVKTEKDPTLQYVSVYENTENRKIVISSKNVSMLSLIYNFYDVNKDFIQVNYDERFLIVQGVELNDLGEIVITYNTVKCLSEANVPVLFNIENIGGEIYLGGVIIVSGSPSQIVFSNEGGQVAKLSNVEDNAKVSADYLQVIVSYDGDYTYSYKLFNSANPSGWNVAINDVNKVFNSKITGHTVINEIPFGFQDETDKGQELDVEFDSRNKTIFNTDNLSGDNAGKLLVEKSGETILVVKIGTTTQYLKVQTITQGFNLTTTEEKISFDINQSSASLKNYVHLTHENSVNDLVLSTNNLVYVSDVKCVTYGDGNLDVNYDEKTNTWTMDKGETNILTISSDSTNGWSFTKTNAYIPLTITFDVETVSGNIDDIMFTFTSSITVSVNESWSNNRKFYVGTKVLLQEEDNDFAVFKETSTVDIEYSIENNLGARFDANTNNEITISNAMLGHITVVATLTDGTVIARFDDFVVLPNVIVNSVNDDLKSETIYNVNSIYNLSSYKNIVYGKDENSLYTSTNATGTPVGLVINPVGTNNNPKLSWNGSQLEIGPMTKIGTEQREIELVYNYEVNEIPFIEVIKLENGATKALVNVTNKYQAQIKRTFEEDGVIRIKSLEEYKLEDVITITNSNHGFVLKDVEIEASEVVEVQLVPTYLAYSYDETSWNALWNKLYVFDGEKYNLNTEETYNNSNSYFVFEDHFVINTIINKELNNAVFVFTFTNGEQDLIYRTSYDDSVRFSIDPYTPEEKQTIPTAFSGAKYDLLNDIYDVDSFDAEKIKTLLIKSVLDENGDEITIVFNKNTGFSGNAGAKCEVTFAEIDSSIKNIVVTYEITYPNTNIAYSYEKIIALRNRQTITTQYPETNVSLSNGGFKFDSNYSKDAIELGGKYNQNLDLYTFTTFSFEPVLVYTDISTTLSFGYDDVKKISRANVETESGAIDRLPEGTSVGEDVTIKLVGYQNNSSMAEYFAEMTKETTNQVVLGKAPASGFNGALVFRLESNSGNYTHYVVYVYCYGSSDSAKTTNNMNVVAHSGYNLFELDTDFEHVQMEENHIVNGTSYDTTTYFGLIDSINDIKFNNKFKREFTKTSLYLYNGDVTGDSDFDYDLDSLIDGNSKQWSKLLTTDKITSNKKFNTIIIGLVYNDGPHKYCYGTITLYVQPEEEILATELGYEIPNGNFFKHITASMEKFDCPLGEGWTARIVSSSQDGVAEIDGSSVKFNPTDKETVIKVEYTLNETVVYIEYTYQATTIPTQTNEPISIGEFDNSNKKFKNSIEIINEKFFGTYSSDDYEVYVLDDQDRNQELGVGDGVIGNAEFDGTSLIFTQTTEIQTIRIKIVYAGLVSTNKERVFTFSVKAGVYLDTSSTSDTSGLNSNDQAPTVAVTGYSSIVGSKLTFTKTPITNGGVTIYEYKVGELKIYTCDDSELELTFNQNDYVIRKDGTNVLGQTETYTVSSTEDLSFAHTIDEQDLIISIKVVKADELKPVYTTRNLYVRIVQTYTGLKAKYLTEGADHENVPSANIIEGLHGVMFGLTPRYALLDKSGNEVYTFNIGLTEVKNPNYVKFEVKELNNGALNNDGTNLTFVTNNSGNNVICELLLTNKAGLVSNKDNTYVYQVMSGNYYDGMDYNYSATNRYNGTSETTKYITFTMNDEDLSYSNETKPFVIGKLLDRKNYNVFTLDYIAGAEQYGPYKMVEGMVDAVGYDFVGNYENATQYKLATDDGYNLYLTYNHDSGYVELIAIRPQLVELKNIELTINASGVNGQTGGESTLINGLVLYLSADNVKSKFETKQDEVYANDIISLFEYSETDGNWSAGKFVENGGSESKLKYELTESVYYVGEDEYMISHSATNKNNNSLFIFDTTAQTLEIKSVGQDVTSVINFLVKSQDEKYILKTITYRVKIKLNLQFMVNDETLKAGSDLETNFVLIPSKDADGNGDFPISIDFNTQQFSNLSADVDNSYYKTLAFDLYRLNQQGNPTASQSSLWMDSSNATISLRSGNIDSSVLSVSKTGIVFNKDYSGDIELKLSVPTSVGVYEEIWIITVFGVSTFEYASTEHELARIDNNTYPFVSGDTVGIVNNDREADSGVIMSQFKAFSTELAGVARTMNYEYVINPNNDITELLTNEALFAIDTEYYIGGGEGSEQISGYDAEITLPNVPSTSNQANQTYFVTYKIYFTYKGLTEQDVQPFYVTYVVQNIQYVEAVNADINVEERIDSTTNADIQFLDLFYYTETLTKGGETYNLIYTQDAMILKVNDTVFNLNSQNENNKEFKSVDPSINDVYKFNTQTHELSKNDATVGKMEKTTNNNGVFNSNFSNIFEFKNFIDVYSKENAKVKLTQIVDNVEQTAIEFTLFELEDDGEGTGRYGIDLAENLTAGETLFNNEMRAKLSLVDNDVETITVGAYSPTNTSGFRLYAPNKITAKTNDGEGMTLASMFLPKYFKAESGSKVTINSAIIGVGEPTNDWVDGASGTPVITKNGEDNKVFATVSIPGFVTDAVGDSAVVNNVYYIYQVTYSGTNTDGKIYSISQSFYYLGFGEDEGSVQSLVVPNYKIGLESSWFRINGSNVSADGYVELNLSNAVKVWNMVDGELVSSSDGVVYSDLTIIENNGEDPELDGNIIKMDASVLETYKLENPSMTSYPMMKVGIVVMFNAIQVNLSFSLEYTLPN